MKTTKLGAAALVGIATVAGAGTVEQLQKVLPADGAPSQIFGRSLSVDGETAAISSYQASFNGLRSGAAYLFDVATGEQLARLLAFDGAAGDEFGRSVDVQGDYIVVGARGDDDRGQSSGSAYVYDRQTLALVHKLVANDGEAGDEFGSSVAVYGDTIAVGAPFDDDNGNSSGSVYIFDAKSGQQIHKLQPSTARVNDEFGASVALQAGSLVVGAPGVFGKGSDAGAVFLFNANTGKEHGKFMPGKLQAGDELGISVAIFGTKVVAGAHRANDDAGAAYVFDTLTLEQIAYLEPEGGSSGDRFGTSVDIMLDTVIIGANLADGLDFDTGLAFLFSATTGTQIGFIEADDAARNDQFGIAVGLSKDSAVVGARWDDDNGTNSGAAYTFAVEVSGCILDLDGSGLVDLGDVNEILTRFGGATVQPFGDITGDGIVDLQDLGLIISAFGTTCG